MRKRTFLKEVAEKELKVIHKGVFKEWVKVYKGTKSKDIKMKVKDLEAIPHITFGIKDYVAKVESQLLKDLNNLKYELKRQREGTSKTHESISRLKQSSSRSEG